MPSMKTPKIVRTKNPKIMKIDMYGKPGMRVWREIAVKGGNAPGAASDGHGKPTSADDLEFGLADLLERVAQDRSLSALPAAGLELALDERRLVARHDDRTIETARTLQIALEQFGSKR